MTLSGYEASAISNSRTAIKSQSLGEPYLTRYFYAKNWVRKTAKKLNLKKLDFGKAALPKSLTIALPATRL